MTENFKLWLVMSGLMLLIIIILCLILKIKERIELKKFKKLYDLSKENNTFTTDYPNMSGNWEVDKKVYIMLKEKNRKMKEQLYETLMKNNLNNEPKEEI